MLELDNIKNELNTYRDKIKEVYESLDIANKKKKLDELNMVMQESNFWNDVNKANSITKEVKDIKSSIDSYENLYLSFNDINSLIEMYNGETEDKEIIDEIKTLYKKFVGDIEETLTTLLLSGEYDDLDAIIKLNAGSGGTESCDFCQMLYRMYTRYTAKHNYEVIVNDYLDGDEAGIKSVEFIVKGKNAYGYLKSEMGVHRLVRISPFNAQGKRQTSFVSCDVMPDIKTDINIFIKPEDIKMEAYRASGAGGQHINKTSSAVRLTHIPTGIVVACQEERSQIQNRERAMQMLKSKLFFIKEKENKSKLSDIRGEVKENAFGSQIRSYVLHPYRMVKDLRTGEETGNTDAVLDGEIEIFVNSYLKWLQLGCPDRKINLQD